jgi:Tol biopolymer transport system component
MYTRLVNCQNVLVLTKSIEHRNIMRRIFFCLIGMLFISLTLPVAAQDALNLPAELYVLTNDGVVQQYGLGRAGLRTVTPEGTFVLDFGVAPDGNWLAYRTETGLNLRHMYTGQETVIENATAGFPPVRGRGDTIAWSPQGDALAYTTPYGARLYFNTGAQPVFADLREGQFIQLDWSPDGRYLAAETEGNIWWIYRREDTNMVLTSAIPSGLGVAWVSPTQLVFTPADGGMIGMDLANANAQTVLLDNSQIYEQPQQLPDGRLVAFARDKQDEDASPGSGLLAAAGVEGTPEFLSETEVDVSAMRWTPPGELNFLVALQGGVMALVDPISAQGFSLPITDVVAYSWGFAPPPTVTGMALPTNGYFLSQDGTGFAQVWRLPADGSPAAPITTLETDVISFAVSPEGRNLAYSDGTHIWLQALDDDSEPEELYTAEDGGVTSLTFSPDGRRLAFVDGGVWIIPTNGGDPQPVLDAPPPATELVWREYSRPQFAPNLDALLINILKNDGVATGMIDTNASELFEMPPGYANGHWLSDGRIVTFGGLDNPYVEGGLHLTDANTLDAPAVLLADTVAVLDASELEPGTLRLLMAASASGPSALRVVDMNTTTGALVPAANGGFITSPSLSPDGQFVAGYRYLMMNENTSSQEGPLTIRDLTSGQQVILNEPSPVWDFQWEGRR